MHAPVVPSRGSSNQHGTSFDADLLVHPDHAPERARSDSTGSAGRANSLTSDQSYLTEETDEQPSVILAPLQEKPVSQGRNDFDPLEDEDEGSYDLVSAPVNPLSHGPSVERRSKQLISYEHLRTMFDEPTLFRHFVGFLSKHRRTSIPVLIYYLDAVKSLRAIEYANTLAVNLDVISSLDFTQSNPEPIISKSLQEKADKAFDVMVREDLPAYIAHVYVQMVSPSISKRIAGTLEPHLQEASEGLAEVFCLTDPSREDNPIVFASEEFNRTTQYGMNYIVGRNCRFLQGPETDRTTVSRLKAAIQAGKESCEVLLNYRRDGSPFLNLLMMAPLTDSRGRLRYFIGAQIDVSGLVKQGTDLDGLNKMLEKEMEAAAPTKEVKAKKDGFEELCELFNHTELKTISEAGGRIYRDQTPPPSTNRHHPHVDPESDSEDEEPDTLITGRAPSHKPRLLLRENSSDDDELQGSHSRLPSASSLSSNGRLGGVFQQYLLVRPYPSLRILFTSPSLRVPGILQSPLMSRIGGSSRVREDLTAALAEGRGVTAKVKWVTRFDTDGGGRSRFLHFTPLIGVNGQIGVWMVVVVDVEKERSKDKESSEASSSGQRRKMAPAVMDGTEMANRSAASLRRVKAVPDPRTSRSAAIRREEATAGGSTRASSRDGSALSVRL